MKSMSRFAKTICFVGAFSLLLLPVLFAAEGHEYVGAKKCGMCHKTAAQGEQLKIWQDSDHAKAFETLGTEKSKKIAAEKGILDPQTSGKCLKCHSTAYGLTENKVTEVLPVEEGVSCESCHGAGKDYMKLSVMKDKEKAVAAGLVLPDEQMCIKCHNSESPTFKPFSYPERQAEISHSLPTKI